ncbi:MAG: DUF47 domain-containing protein [Firmicutes bacterium]|nr:DUF47 domain-containing protein [Bacillota bacterium]
MFRHREERFFSLFDQAAENILEAARVLAVVACEPGQANTRLKELEDREHRGDELTHDLLAELNRAFITPIDREDIFLIAKEMDTIIDSIEATGHRYVMLRIEESPKEVKELARMIVAAAEEMVTMMKSLRNLRHLAAENKSVVEINRLEDEGDKIYRAAVRELYSGAYDVLFAIRWREIYDHLKDTLDALEDVANIVEGIAMKHA